MNIYSTLTNQISEILSEHPHGLRQSQIAAKLGIPRAKDNNWIAYYLLKAMQNEGLVTKDNQKTFFLAQ